MVKNLLVEINSGVDAITSTGKFFIRYANSEPYYDFVILPAGAKQGDDKISIVEKDGVFYLEMDDALVKKIKLYDDQEEARADLWTNEVFPGLKDGEIEVFLF